MCTTWIPKLKNRSLFWLQCVKCSQRNTVIFSKMWGTQCWKGLGFWFDSSYDRNVSCLQDCMHRVFHTIIPRRGFSGGIRGNVFCWVSPLRPPLFHVLCVGHENAKQMGTVHSKVRIIQTCQSAQFDLELCCFLKYWGYYSWIHVCAEDGSFSSFNYI